MANKRLFTVEEAIKKYFDPDQGSDIELEDNDNDSLDSSDDEMLENIPYCVDNHSDSDRNDDDNDEAGIENVDPDNHVVDFGGSGRPNDYVRFSTPRKSSAVSGGWTFFDGFLDSNVNVDCKNVTRGKASSGSVVNESITADSVNNESGSGIYTNYDSDPDYDDPSSSPGLVPVITNGYLGKYSVNFFHFILTYIKKKKLDAHISN